MEWRFRKRVRIIPGIYLNLGSKGISTTISPRGFSVNIRPNTDLPGSRQIPAENSREIADKLRYMLEQTYDGSEQIKSEAIDQLTSPGLAFLKQTIMAAHEEYAGLSAIIRKKENEKRQIDQRVGRLRRSLFKFLYKKRIVRLTAETQVHGEELQELHEQLELSTVDLQIHSDETFGALYRNVERGYELLSSCSKIWDVTTSKVINRVQARSAAGTEVRRAEVRASLQHWGLIGTKSVPLKLENKNGGDLYFYPGFVLIHERELDFAILDYSEFSVSFQYQRFVESEPVPSDAAVVGKTWNKVNKDGSPDRRFTGNYQIPITNYGGLSFTSPTGLNERYHVSNAEYAQLFYQALDEYIKAVKTAHSLLGAFAKR